jgi:non-canonical (house-cleaning) NTP pyrophosphatase
MNDPTVVIVNSSSLKLKILKNVFSAYLPKIEFKFIESEIDNFSGDSIGRDDCIDLMRVKISEARLKYPNATYYVFMRGRMEDDGNLMQEFALVLIQDLIGNEGISDAASFEVPKEIANLVRSGVSFSTAVEQVFKVPGVKNGSGFVGILTNGVVMKEEQYFQPAVIALATCAKKAI